MSATENTLISPIATLFTTWIMYKFGLNYMHFSLVMPLTIALITAIWSYFTSDWSMEMSIIIAILVGIVSISCIYLLYIYKKEITSYFGKQRVCATIIDPKELNIFKKYYGMNNKIFTNNKDISYGDIEITAGASIMNARTSKNWSVYKDLDANITTTTLNKSFDFNDTNFNVIGACTWRKHKTPIKSNNSNSENKDLQVLPITEWVYIYPEITIYTKESSYDIFTYFEKIKEYITQYENRHLNLKYVKCFNNKDKVDTHSITFYSGLSLALEEKERMFIKPFLHNNNSQVIWEILKKVQYDPAFFAAFGQNARANLLLYGPPGSGKSSFIYRIANCLNRHIVSVDISTIGTKYALYKTIQKPSVDATDDPKNSIIVLEEFDIAIKKLFLAEQDDLNTEKNEKMMMAALESKGDNFKELVKIKDNDKIILRDLLDILQGTIPIDGSIIIATTNKYEEIKEYCPELFRAGRMTPVYFGYLDLNGFKNFCQNYFEELPSERLCSILFPDDIDINKLVKTSEFVEVAMQFKASFSNKEAFIRFGEYFLAKN